MSAYEGGRVTDGRVWNRVLSDEEIAAYENATGALRRAWGANYEAFAEDWMDDGINDDYTGPADPPT